MEHILFYDPACPAPYSSESLGFPGSKIGGAESTMVRVAEHLGQKYRVSVGQHNRSRHEESRVCNLQWLTKREATSSSLNADIIVVQRKVGVLPFMKWHHPKARLFVWSHDWFDPRPVGPSTGAAIWRAKNEMRFFLHTHYDAVSVAVSRTHMENIRESLEQTWAFNRLRHKVKFDFVYNPIDDDLVTVPGKPAYDPDKLIFFSASWKGLDIVLNSFRAVRQHLPELRLYVASPGYQPPAQWDEALTENVYFLGSLTHETVVSEVRSALCVFYPADKVPEAFGLVFAESNAVGTPVLAHPFGAAPELLTPDQLVDARDLNGIVERLRLWRSGARPIVRAREEYRMSNVVRSWERVLFS